MRTRTEKMIAAAASRLYLTTTAAHISPTLSTLAVTETKHVVDNYLRKFSSLTEAYEKTKDTAVKTIEVLIWHDTGKASNWGHAALCAGGEYLSVWPEKGVGPTRAEGKSYPTRAALSTYEDDTKAEAIPNAEGILVPRHPDETIKLAVTEKEFREIMLRVKTIKHEIETGKRGYVAVVDVMRSTARLFKPSAGDFGLSKSGNCITHVNCVLIGTRYHIEMVPLFTLPRAYSKLIKAALEKTGPSSTVTDPSAKLS